MKKTVKILRHNLGNEPGMKNMIKVKSKPEWMTWMHNGGDQRPKSIFSKEKSREERKKRAIFVCENS